MRSAPRSCEPRASATRASRSGRKPDDSGGFEVDFLWRDQKVIVETDGFRNHGQRSAFEQDRAKDAHLQSRGFRVLRFTYRQVRDRSPVVATLRALVGQDSPAPNL